MQDSDYQFIRKILFDADEKRPIPLKNAANIRIDFEQVFAIERDGKIFCILRPLTSIEGLSVHAALAFSVDEDGAFRAVREKQLSEEIFAEYYKLCRRRRRRRGNEQ